MTATYRVKGTTGDVNQCEQCRTRLSKAVVLAVLDVDGNEIEIVHFGTDCAARATGYRQAYVARLAAKADVTAAGRREWARDILDMYEPVEGDVRATARLFFDRNPTQRGRTTASAAVAEMLAQARTILAA
ncbi:hypothetical protein [Streptosporangium sp. NPDC048865]|uniref:hypothetical protein n=1 Tax=Streptosporangium sp. NPDC048865 TaxID=3155766 RepID=UPI0034373CEF